jgi:hypothetical protein
MTTRTQIPVTAGGAGGWVWRNRHEEWLRLTDACVMAIIGLQPLLVDTLDALPPWRAAHLARIAAGAGTGIQRFTYEQVLAAAQRAQPAAGPGWLTGRQHRTCPSCGRTCWDTTAVHHLPGCADA